MRMAISLPTSLGEIINAKFHLDEVKHQYESISINFNKGLWNGCLHTDAPDWETKRVGWDKYLDDIGRLFFREPPYQMVSGNFSYYDMGDLAKAYRLVPKKPKMIELLCKGTSLGLDEPYFVLTTKVRDVERALFYPLSFELWRTLKRLSERYKIVVLGERKVELRREYGNGHDIFGLYDQIISNIPNDRLVDLTVPALGESVSDLKQIQQDCLIMNEAKFVITLGIGGNFCMAVATAKMVVGYRADDNAYTDLVYNREFPDAVITKDWHRFIQALENQ
jgi:hypothetical protein